MSIVRRTLAPTVLALLLAGSGCAPFPAVTTAGTAPAASPAPSLAVGDLRGQVSVPVVAAGSANVVAAGSANVVAAGSANVVAAGSANVVAAGSANVVAAGSANVIAPGGGNYRLAQAAGPAEELPVFGAVVILRDAVTRQRLPWAQPTFTDEKGQFHIPQVPAGMNYLVEVVFLTRDGRTMRLLTLAQAGTTDRTVAVDWRTTAVVTAMQSAANAQGGMYVADPQAMDTAIAELDKAAAAMPASERAATLTKAVAATPPKPTGQETAVVAPEAVNAMRDRLAAMTGAKQDAATLVISEVMPPTEMAPARDVAEAMASKSPALAQALTTLKGLAAATPTAAQQSTASQAGQLAQASPAPSNGNASSGATSPSAGGANAGVSTGATGTGATVSTGTGAEASVSTGTGGTTVNAGTGTGTEASVSTGASGTEASVSTGTGTTANVSTGAGGTEASVDTGAGVGANVSTGGTGTEANVSAGGTTTTVSTGSGGTTAGTTTSGGTGATATTGGSGTSVGVTVGGGTSVTVGTGGSTGISLGGKKILSRP